MKDSTRPVVSAVCIALIVAGGCFRMDFLANRSFQADLRATITERSAALRTTLEQSVNLHLRALTAGKSVIAARPVLDDEQVQHIGPTLVHGSPAIRGIIFSPADSSSIPYWRKGAEQGDMAFGLVRSACAERGLRAGRNDSVELLGPLSGPPGLFALEPVYLQDDTGQPAFWGCVSVMLDYANLILPAIPLLRDPAVEFSLRAPDSVVGPGELISGAEQLPAGAVTDRVLFPGGELHIASQPRDGWDQPRPYGLALRLLMITACLLIAAVTWVIHTRGIRNRQLLNALEAGEQARRQWVADTSHELRTPITILSTHLDALRDGIITLTPDEIELLSDTVAGMEKLVTDLHQLARSDASALAFDHENVDLAELLEELQQAFALRFAQQQMTLTVYDFAPGLSVRADRLRLIQVLSNLWTNTLRYTDAGGRATVTLTRAQGQVCIRCDDSAPGVPDEALPRLFERFFRVDSSRNRASGGSGLGLAICQSIIEAHGGKMVAHHSPLGGLCVELTLPEGTPT
jgi:signal transduction histidine kinase